LFEDVAGALGLLGTGLGLAAGGVDDESADDQATDGETEGQNMSEP